MQPSPVTVLGVFLATSVWFLAQLNAREFPSLPVCLSLMAAALTPKSLFFKLKKKLFFEKGSYYITQADLGLTM